MAYARICRFLPIYSIIKLIFMDFGLSVGQNKQLEDFFHHFLTFKSKEDKYICVAIVL